MVVVCEPAAGRIDGRRRGAVRRGPLCLGCLRVGESWVMVKWRGSGVGDEVRSDWCVRGTIHECCRCA